MFDGPSSVLEAKDFSSNIFQIFQIVKRLGLDHILASIIVHKIQFSLKDSFKYIAMGS